MCRTKNLMLRNNKKLFEKKTLKNYFVIVKIGYFKYCKLGTILSYISTFSAHN